MCNLHCQRAFLFAISRHDYLNVFYHYVQCAVEVDGQVVPVKIVGTRLITDRNTGQTKGFGYVEFGTPEEVGFLCSYIIRFLFCG